MSENTPLPAALRERASALSGSYADRYPQIIEAAFRDHQLLLNAAQLRQLAGGGSQTTAQRAIDAWRDKMFRMLSTKLNVGPDVPAEITAAFEQAVIGVWSTAKSVAEGSFQEERTEMLARVAQAEAHLETLRTNHAAVVDERDALVRELVQTQEALESTVAARDAAALRADAHAREAETLRAQLATLRDQHEAAKRSHEEALAAVNERHQDRLRDLGEAHRREVAGIQHAADRAVAAAQAERKTLAAERDTAVRERTEADIARARAERDADQARQAAEAAVLRVQEAGAALDRLQAEAATQRERQAVELAEARARAMDLAPLLGWLAAGCAPGMAGLDDRQKLVAQAVLQVLAVREHQSKPPTGKSRKAG